MPIKKTISSSQRAVKKSIAVTKKPTAAGKKPAIKKLAPKFFTAALDVSSDNLSKFDHIVVLMLENRSFDHKLGYLSLEGGRNGIDGLMAGMSNPDNNNVPMPIFHLDRTGFTKEEDRCQNPPPLPHE